MTIPSIRSWLLGNNTYNAIVRVNGVKYRVNNAVGIIQASMGDSQIYPQLEAPKWLEEMILRGCDRDEL